MITQEYIKKAQEMNPDLSSDLVNQLLLGLNDTNKWSREAYYDFEQECLY